MNTREPDTSALLIEASRGDESARGLLFERHRERLKTLLHLRLDRRLLARVDPSDLVQETLAAAHDRLDGYLADRPLPFYPWLRQIALDRVADHYRRYVRAGKRAIGREERRGLPLPDESTTELVNRLVGRASTPCARMRREEDRRRVHAALDRLSERDREVLVLRYLEQMPPREIAAVLDLSEAAVHKRHLRALERLGTHLTSDWTEERS